MLHVAAACAEEKKKVEEETAVKREEHKAEQAKLAAQRKAEAEAARKKAEADAAAAAEQAANEAAAAQAQAEAAAKEGQTATQEVGNGLFSGQYQQPQLLCMVACTEIKWRSVCGKLNPELVCACQFLCGVLPRHAASCCAVH